MVATHNYIKIKMENHASICGTLASLFSIGLCIYGTPSQIWIIWKKKAADEISGPNTYMTAGYAVFMCGYGFEIHSAYIFVPEFIGSISSVLLVILVIYYKYFNKNNTPPPL